MLNLVATTSCLWVRVDWQTEQNIHDGPVSLSYQATKTTKRQNDLAPFFRWHIVLPLLLVMFLHLVVNYIYIFSSVCECVCLHWSPLMRSFSVPSSHQSRIYGFIRILALPPILPLFFCTRLPPSVRPHLQTKRTASRTVNMPRSLFRESCS